MQRKWRVTLIVCVGVFMASLDLFIVNIAFPSIGHAFPSSSLSSLSWILNGYAIVFAALLVPAGRWADAYGRKRVFLIGMGVFTLASAACAAAPSVAVLVAARTIQAAGAALMLPTSLGLMLPEFSAAERPAAIGAWAAAGGIAAAAGPPLGGLLVQADWSWVFLVNLPIGIVAFGAALRTLGEIREPDAQRPDVLGAALLAVAIGALVVAIVKGGAWSWGSVRVLGLFAAAALLLVAVGRRSRRHVAPVIDPAMLRERGFTLAVLASLLFFAGFAAMLLTGVLFLTGVWHESVLRAGLMLAPGPAMAALFSVPSARLGGRVGYRIPGVAGSLLFAVSGAWWLSHAGAVPAYATDFLPAMIVGGAGVGLVIPTLTGAGAAALPPERFATGAAVLTMGRQIGSALGIAALVAVLGTATTSVAGLDGAWRLMIGCALASAATLAALGPPARVRAARAPAAEAAAEAPA